MNPAPIVVKCPACGTELKAPPELAGRRARCRVCRGVIAVPSPAEPELLPLDDEPAPLDFLEDEPRPRKSTARKRPAHAKRPVWPWIAGGAALVLILAVGGYLAFGRKGGSSSGITLAGISGDWVGEADGDEYRYSFFPEQRGIIMVAGHGAITMRGFDYDVQTFSGTPTIIIRDGGPGEGTRIPASMDSEGRLILGQSYRRERDLGIHPVPMILRKAEPLKPDAPLFPPGPR